MAPRKGSRFNPFTTEEIALVKDLYAKGETPEKIAERVGKSRTGVRNLLSREGVPKRKAGHHLRKYHSREDAFDDALNDEEAAYWVGFLLADGCVVPSESRQPFLSLELAKRDAGHVFKFASFLGLPSSVVKTGGSRDTSYRLRIRSWKLAESLANYGVVPRKSLTANPKLLTNNRHFWRGVFDGDGCIHLRKLENKRHSGLSVAASLAGSKETISAFSRFVKQRFPFCRVTIKAVRNVFCFATTGGRARDIVELLYKGASIALDRKRELAERVLIEFNQFGYSQLSREDSPCGRFPRGRRFLTLRGETKPLAEWARVVGIPEVTLAARLRNGWTDERALEEPVQIDRRKTLVCTVPDCNSPHVAKGYCTKHYKRFRKASSLSQKENLMPVGSE